MQKSALHTPPTTPQPPTPSLNPKCHLFPGPYNSSEAQCITHHPRGELLFEPLDIEPISLSSLHSVCSRLSCSAQCKWSYGGSGYNVKSNMRLSDFLDQTKKNRLFFFSGSNKLSSFVPSAAVTELRLMPDVWNNVFSEIVCKLRWSSDGCWWQELHGLSSGVNQQEQNKQSYSHRFKTFMWTSF